jgi:hypothetical protein
MGCCEMVKEWFMLVIPVVEGCLKIEHVLYSLCNFLYTVHTVCLQSHGGVSKLFIAITVNISHTLYILNNKPTYKVSWHVWCSSMWLPFVALHTSNRNFISCHTRRSTSGVTEWTASVILACKCSILLIRTL